ncbi:MAG: AAA family ATPase, partial [Aquisalinus sp.]|nr:AAA family ATPase [Aquisalinus sp.]
MTTSSTITQNRLLHDLDDHVYAVEPNFRFIGEGDIERIASILGQHRHSNLIYVGQSGAGKTSNIFGIIDKKRRAIEGKVQSGERRLPLHMIDRRFMLLDTATLFASSDPQLIEQNIKHVFAELDKPGDHVLVVEDANDLLRGIENNHCQGMISILVRELRRGSFHCILMVREEPGKNRLNDVLAAHSDMAELFTVLERAIPPKERVQEIMDESKPALEQHFDGLRISDDANREIVNLTHQYPNLRMYMRAQPARSLRMRDRIASNFVSRMQSRPPELDLLEAQLAEVEDHLSEKPGEETFLSRKSEITQEIAKVYEVWEARAAALGAAYMKKREHEKALEGLHLELGKETEKLRDRLQNDYKREPSEGDLAAFKTPEIKEVEKYIRETRKALEQIDAEAQAVKNEHNQELMLTVGHVREFFSEISGIPTKDLNADEASRALGLADRMKENIFGQDEVVGMIADAVLTAKAGLNNPDAPIGSFIAVGSSGTGKTYSAECLAEELFDDPDALTVFDMSEFMEKHTVARLIGAPPGYAGYGEGGMLTNTVRARPYQVILLDEIEKAHPDVFKILLQLLDKGRLSDELGTVDFKNTLLILTTNLGQHFSFDPERTSENSADEIKSEIRKIFPQELINRVDSFLLFKALQPQSIVRILKRLITKKNDNLAAQKKPISIDLPDQDIEEIVNRKYLPEEGARQVQKFVQNNLINQAARIVLANS